MRLPAAGVPANPAAWLTTTARQRAIDAIRRDAALRARLPLLVVPDGSSAELAAGHPTADAEAAAARLSEVLPDERLHLILICCHPALAQEARWAHAAAGVRDGVPDIARALLVAEATMAARITGRRRRLRRRIPYRIPARPTSPTCARPSSPSSVCSSRPATWRRRAPRWSAPIW